MAGIFNLFGDTLQPARGQVLKPLARSKTSLGITGASAKALVQPKPKGLSIRPSSDSNVTTTSRVGLNHETSKKPQDCLKPKLTQLNNGGRPISPRKKNNEHSKIKDLTPKELTFEKKTIKSQKPDESEQNVFKKPLPPKKLAKNIYPEPEEIEPYYDIEFEFDDIYTKTIANEFRDYLMQKEKEVVPYQDEGFESDPEPTECDIPNLRLSPLSFNAELRKYSIPDLPQISDNEDGF